MNFFKLFCFLLYFFAPSWRAFYFLLPLWSCPASKIWIAKSLSRRYVVLEAEEVISYQIPCFKFKGYLIYYAAVFSYKGKPIISFRLILKHGG